MWLYVAVFALCLSDSLAYYIDGVTDGTTVNGHSGALNGSLEPRYRYSRTCTAEQQLIVRRALWDVGDWAYQVVQWVPDMPYEPDDPMRSAFRQIFATIDARARTQIRTRFHAIENLAEGRHAVDFTFTCSDPLNLCEVPLPTGQQRLGYSIAIRDSGNRQRHWPGEALV